MSAQAVPSVIEGTLGGTGWSLARSGTATTAEPGYVRFQGRGDIGDETGVYDYSGFVLPDWPEGVDQVDAIVGTIVQTVPHSGGRPSGRQEGLKIHQAAPFKTFVFVVRFVV